MPETCAWATSDAGGWKAVFSSVAIRSLRHVVSSGCLFDGSRRRRSYGQALTQPDAPAPATRDGGETTIRRRKRRIRADRGNPAVHEPPALAPPPPSDDGQLARSNASRQRLLPSLIFSSRWLQLPLYLGLIVAQAVYVFHFWVELIHLIEAAFGNEPR